MNSIVRSASVNRRRRVRHRIQTPAYATFLQESKSAMLDLHEVVDVSEDGVAIQCNAPIKKKGRFDLCLDLADSSGQIFTTAEPVWSDGSGRSGFRFAQLAPDSLFHLREWLFLNAMAGVVNAEPAIKRPVAAVVLRTNYTDTLAAVNAVRNEIQSQGSDLVAALDLIAARAKTLLRASGVAIALTSSDPDFMVCRASAGVDAPPVGARLQVGSGFSGECVSTGLSLLCEDTEIDERVDRESCRALGIRSILAAPVKIGDHVAGLLEAFSPDPGSFTSDQSTLLSRLADMISSAVGRTANSARSINSEMESVEEEIPAISAPQPVLFNPLPGSILFASEVRQPNQAEDPSELNAENEAEGGIRLPRSLLLVLICAAATIALALGFILAPWIQKRFRSQLTHIEQIVHASTQPSKADNPPDNTAVMLPPKPVASTANLEQLQQLAAGGDAAAENALGLRYATGDGVQLNEKEAARWFTEAAERGNLTAQYKLALIYWGGHGIPKDYNKAYFWAVLARAGNQEGARDLVKVLSTYITDAQAASIRQEAERWFQQQQVQSAPTSEARR